MSPIKAANQLDISVLMKADMQCEQPQDKFAPVAIRLKFEDLFQGCKLAELNKFQDSPP